MISLSSDYLATEFLEEEEEDAEMDDELLDELDEDLDDDDLLEDIEDVAPREPLGEEDTDERPLGEKLYGEDDDDEEGDEDMDYDSFDDKDDL